MLERRRTPRYPIDKQARLTLLAEPAISTVVTIRNISEGGLQLMLNLLLRTGESLRLEAEDVDIHGYVQYCCHWKGGYVAGILLEEIRFRGRELTTTDFIENWAALQQA